MIYITGDCHGDFKRFNKKNFPEQLEQKMISLSYAVILAVYGTKTVKVNMKKCSWIGLMHNLLQHYLFLETMKTMTV